MFSLSCLFSWSSSASCFSWASFAPASWACSRTSSALDTWSSASLCTCFCSDASSFSMFSLSCLFSWSSSASCFSRASFAPASCFCRPSSSAFCFVSSDSASLTHFFMQKYSFATFTFNLVWTSDPRIMPVCSCSWPDCTCFWQASIAFISSGNLAVHCFIRSTSSRKVGCTWSSCYTL